MCCRLTKQERKRLSDLILKQKYSWRKIWELMWRDHSVLYREYQRNRRKFGKYDPDYANTKAEQKKYKKRKVCKTIRMNDVIEKFIIQHLLIWRSCEVIAWNRNEVESKKHHSPHLISWMMIRRYLKSKFAKVLRMTLLDRKLLKKYKKNSKHWKRKWWKIKDRTFIDVRPEIIWLRLERWHCEVDFIESIRWDSTVILTVIERVTRVSRAILLPDKKERRVTSVLLALVQKFWLKSMTFDNDLSFAWHLELWIPTYFCHTYSSREKWQIERRNRWYRKFFPKKTILKNLTQRDIDAASKYLNNYPLRCLGYVSPYTEYTRIKWKFKLTYM